MYRVRTETQNKVLEQVKAIQIPLVETGKELLQLKILKFMKFHEYYTIKDFSKLGSICMIRLALKELERKRLVKKLRSTQNFYYRLINTHVKK